MFHPSLHLLPLVCDDFPSGGFEGGRLDAIVHTSDVPCDCCCLDDFAELCPVLVGAVSGSLLSFVSGSP